MLRSLFFADGGYGVEHAEDGSGFDGAYEITKAERVFKKYVYDHGSVPKVKRKGNLLAEGLDSDKFYGAIDMYVPWLKAIAEHYPGRLAVLYDCEPKGFFRMMSYSEQRNQPLNTSGQLVSRFRAALGENYRFVAWILSIRENGGQWHANALVYDRKKDVVYRFDSKGSGTKTYDHSAVDRHLEDWVHKYIGPDVRVDSKFQNVRGPQYLEKVIFDSGVSTDHLYAGGSCGAWALLFIQLLVGDEFGHDPNKIVEAMAEIPEERLSEYIRIYANHVATFSKGPNKNLNGICPT